MTAEPKNKPQRAFILPKDDRRIKTGKLNSSVHLTPSQSGVVLNWSINNEPVILDQHSQNHGRAIFLNLKGFFHWFLFTFELLNDCDLKCNPIAVFIKHIPKTNLTFPGAHDLISSRHFLTIAEGEVKVLRNDYHVADSLKR